jgi:hypothetical protein
VKIENSGILLFIFHFANGVTSRRNPITTFAVLSEMMNFNDEYSSVDAIAIRTIRHYYSRQVVDYDDAHIRRMAQIF